MKLTDLIAQLSGIAGYVGLDAEVMVETGNLMHVDWEFERGKKTLVLKLDMSTYAEAQAELEGAVPVVEDAQEADSVQ